MSKKTSVSNTNLVFEELEARLLLSADGLAVITDSSVAALQNGVNSDNEHTIIVQQHDEQVSTAVLNKTQNNHRTELVVLDSRAPNFQQLHNDIIKAQQQGRDINVVILDAHRDGIEQISEALNKYDKLDAVHIVSHGSDSQLKLGATQLDNQTIQQRSKEIETWKQVFTEGGDLLIYGCNLADTQDGKSMVDTLSSLTATDVAASDDITGNKMYGGDWDLEYTVGELDTEIAFSEDTQQQWQGTLASPVANNDSYSVTEDQTLIINALIENATASDLEAAWQFDEGTGTVTADATSNGNDGTINGATWTSSSRTGDAALSFDGTDDYVQITNSTLDLRTANNFTLTAWFQTDTTTGPHHLLWQGFSTGNGWGEPGSTSPTTSEMNLSVGRFDTNNTISFYMGYDDSVAAAIDITSASTFTDTSGWHQATVVVSDLGGGVLQAELYVDGVLEGSDTGTQIDRSQWVPNLLIGQAGSGTREFNGMIDEVGIYDRALTPAEISALFATGVAANDADSDGDILAASVVSGPSYGSLFLNTDGSFTYIPDADFSGTDSFTYRVNDGTSDSNIATVNITVTPVNDAPILDLDADNSSGSTGLGYDTTYIEAGGAISIVDSDFLLIDADDSIDSVTVRLTNNQVNAPNKEILAATDPDGTGLIIYYDGKEFLTITGTATVAEYQSVLATLTYNNLVNNPNTTPRTITFVVNDGTVDSLVATTTVAVTQSVKPPVNTVPVAQTVAEDTPLAISGLSVKDTDNNLTSVALTVNNGSLNVTVIGGVTISSGANNSSTLTLSGGTETEFNNTLATLVYQGDQDFNGADSLTVLSTDALGGVDADAVSITVTPVDDAPVATDDPGDYGTDISALNPLSYWRFGEAGGGTVTDEGSTGVSASLSGATLGQPGAINGDSNTAAGFDGVNDYAVIAHNSSYMLDDGSIQLWFNADDVSTQQGLISKDSSGFDNGGHFTILIKANGSIETRLQSKTTSYYVNSAAGSLTAGQWHHVAVNFGAGGMELFLDGVSVDTNTYTGGLGTTSGGTGNDEPIAIGGSTIHSDNNSVLVVPETAPRDLFSGKIDEVAIVDQALTAEQIQTLYRTALQNYDITEDSSLVVSASEGVLINDSDLEGSSLNAVLVSGPSNAASFTLNADGSFNYTPVVNFSGTDTFTYVANDGNSDSNVATVTITITGDNDAPVNTVPGAPLTVLEDTQTVIAGISVTDPDAGTGIISTQLSVTDGVLDVTLSGAATISAGSNSSNTLTISGNVTDINNTLASLRYTGNSNVNGTAADTLTVVTNDMGNTGTGGAKSDTDNVQIDITPVNDAPTVANAIADQVATEDSAFSFTFAANTFNDVDGDTFTYTSDASGWLSFNAGTRTFSGTPLNGDVGTTTVTVTANDGNGGTVSDTFDIVISNTNDAPTATNLNAAENYFEDTVLNLTDIVVSDVDSVNVMVTLTLSDVSAGTLSTATSNAVTSTFTAGVWKASGAIDDVNNLLSGLTFTPSQNYNSNFNITTRVEDFGVVPPTTGNKVMTGTALNDVPTVANTIADQVATEDSAFSFTFAANTFNDVDGDTLTYTSNASGWLSFNAGTRTFSGTPLNADVGTTTVVVTANDGNGGTVSDTFDIVIGNTNDAPTVANAIADQVATEDSAFSFTFAANTFNDVDGDALTYTSNASGWLSFNAGTRTFSGTPLNADVGTTTVLVTANDGNGGTVSDTFDIVISNINDTAIIGGVDTGSVTEDVDPDANTLLETGGALTVMDPDVGESSFIAQTINGSYGDLIIDTTGVWNYSADNTQAAIQNLAATDTLTDSFNVTSFDGTTHNVVITIGGVNDAPTAIDDNPVVDEGGTAIFDLAINDVDIDNAINLNSISITGAPANGSVIVNGNGTVNYTHDGSETTSDTFSYTIADITGAISNIATVNIIVNPLNDSPSAQDDAQSVDEGNTVVIDLSANDTDADNALDLSSIVIVAEPTNGTYIVNSNGTVDYTHDGSQTLSDSFSYTISDISGAVSNTATVNIIVNPINNTPTTIGIVDVTVSEDSPVTNIDLNAAFDDVDNLDSELTYSITGNTSIGLFNSVAVNAAAGELVLDYAADMNGSSQITIRVSDPSGASVDTLFTVTVTPVNDAPVLVSNVGMTVQGTGSTVISNSELNVNDIDDTDAVITYTVTSLPESGVLLLNGVPLTINSSFTEADIMNNNLSYQSDGTSETDQFEFTVSDSKDATISNNTFNIVVQLVIPVPEVTTTTFDPVTSKEPVDTNVPALSEGDSSDFNGEKTIQVRHIEDLYTGGASATPKTPKLTLEPTPKTEPESVEQDVFDYNDESIELYESSALNFSTASTIADIQIRSIKALWTAIDEMKEQIDEKMTEDITEVEFRAAAVSSSGVALTAGIVAWVLRSGALMTSLISTIPLWKGYDPLPILAYNNDDEDENIAEDKIPTSLEELKKIKALKEKMKEYNQVDDLFGGSEVEG